MSYSYLVQLDNYSEVSVVAQDKVSAITDMCNSRGLYVLSIVKVSTHPSSNLNYFTHFTVELSNGSTVQVVCKFNRLADVTPSGSAITSNYSTRYAELMSRSTQMIKDALDNVDKKYKSVAF